MIDYIIPLLAVVIALTTKGCYRQINTVLACLLTFIFGYTEYVWEYMIYDSYWHDAVMVFLYGLAAFMFYRLGGRIQFILANIGVVLHVFYGLGWLIPNYDPDSFYYEGVILTLNIIQLLAAHKGQLWSVLYKKIGAHYVRSNADDSHRRSIHRDHG